MGNVAIIFAGLVGAAHDRVIEFFPLYVRVAGHERPDRNRGEVIGAHRSQSAAVTADGGADGVTDECLFAHGVVVL